MNEYKDKTQPGVIVIVGLPGSGKSTSRELAVKMGAAKNSYHYSTDDIIEQYAKQANNKTYNDVFNDYIKIATKKANKGLQKAIEQNKNVLWDQTNLTTKKRKGILSKFPSYYRKDCVCILPPMNEEQEEELARRLRNRPGKTIPSHVLRSMRENFELPRPNEGFDKVMYFDIYGKMVDPSTAMKLFL